MTPIERLLAVMARLRDPEAGCPWDRRQDFRTIAPYTIEEAYEVADAIERGDLDALRDELGDLLFQVVFHARMAEEAGAFDFDAVAEAIRDKMVRRHPHVFAGEPLDDAEAQTRAWEEIKARERSLARDPAAGPASELDDVPRGLAALARAAKIQRRAARVGFDWPDRRGVLDKIDEEAAELRREVERADPDPARVEAELGDLLFTCVNLARHLGADPDRALRAATARFEDRFRAMEGAARTRGRTLRSLSAQEREELWEAAKSTGEANAARPAPGGPRVSRGCG